MNDINAGDTITLRGEPIVSNTTINLYNGGLLLTDVRSFPGAIHLGNDNPSTSDIELNVLGGDFVLSDNVHVYEGSTVNVSDGTVRGQQTLRVESGGTVNVSGGHVSNLYSNRGANINVTGGLADISYTSGSGSLYTTRISGGALGPLSTVPQSFSHRFALAGSEWAVDGVPVGSLTAIGDITTLILSTGTTLTGVLTDGTPIALSTRRGDASRSLGLQLELAAIPSAASEVYASQLPGITGARTGQTVFVDNGGEVGVGFRGAAGSTIGVQTGGLLGDYSEFHNAQLNVTGGSVGFGGRIWGGGTLNLSAGTVERMTFFGLATANISGGTAELYTVEDPQGGTAPTINITGGTVIDSDLDGGVINLSGGVLNGDARSGQTINVSGDGLLADGFRGLGSSQVNVSGGVVGEVRIDGRLTASGGVLSKRVNASNGSLTLIGSEFRYGGQPITGLENIGDATTMFSAPTSDGYAYTGILADGTPFALTNSDLTLGGSIRFELAETTEPLSPAVNVNSVNALHFAVKNQEVTVGEGGVLPQGFTAAPGSTVVIGPGGVFGNQFEAIGANLIVSSGENGDRGALLEGSTAVINDGSLGNNLKVWHGSTLQLQGGSVGDYVTAIGGASIGVAGGILGRTTLSDTSSMQMSGGLAGMLTAEDTAQLNISGGRLTESPRTHASASLNLHGASFKLDGTPVEQIVGGSFSQLGDTAIINVAKGQVLTGELADGTTVVLAPTSSSNAIGTDSLTLTYNEPAPPTPQTFIASTGPAPYAIRAGQVLTVDAGGTAESPIAGPGGRIDVLPGGIVTGPIDSVAGEVNITGGVIEKLRGYQGAQLVLKNSQIDTLEVTGGTSLLVEGGAIGANATLRGGATATISEGAVVGHNITVDGATLALSGATVDGRLVGRAQASLHIGKDALIEGHIDLADAVLTMTGGTADFGFDAVRSTVHFRDGYLKRELNLEDNSQLELSGGMISRMFAVDSDVNVTGGRWLYDSEANNSTFNIDAPGVQLGNLRLVASSNLEFHDGMMDELETYEGSVTNVRGGEIAELNAFYGSVTIHGGEINDVQWGAENTVAGDQLTMAGGSIGYLQVIKESATATQTGGFVDELSVRNDARYDVAGGAVGNGAWVFGELRVSGGTLGRSLEFDGEAVLHLVGGEYTLNGVPIPTIDSVVLADGDLLTGVLQDGTPIAVGGERIHGTNSSDKYDEIYTVNLERQLLPVAPPQINTGTDGVPTGARPDQIITFAPGTASLGRFRAATGSQVIVQVGADLGDHLEAFGATIDVVGGTIGDDALVHANTTLNLTSGRVGNSLRANSGSRVDIKGGTVGDGLIADSSGLVVVSGNEFAIDGVPLTDLVPGATYYVGNFANKRLTGVLEDGTPIMLTAASAGSNFELNARRDQFGINSMFTNNSTESLAIHITGTAPVGPAQITASTDPVPYGIRSGQHLTVDAGALVLADFVAGHGATVEVLAGGTVGHNLEAIGAQVEVRGGAVGDYLEAVYGANILVDGGSLGRFARVEDGASFDLRSGTVGEGLLVQNGSQFAMSGGSVGSSAYVVADVITIDGGEFVGSGFSDAAVLNGQIAISGGRFFEARLNGLQAGIEAKQLHISGGEFIGSTSVFGMGVISGGSFGEQSALVGSQRDGEFLKVTGGIFSPQTRLREYVWVTGGEFYHTTIDGALVDGGEFTAAIIDGYDSVVSGGTFLEETFVDNYARIEGGSFESLRSHEGQIFGGEFEVIYVTYYDELQIYGSEFFLDGVPLELPSENSGLPIASRGGILTGTLADGSPLSIELNELFIPGEDFVSADAELILFYSHPLGDFDFDNHVDGGDFLAWQRGESEDEQLADLHRWQTHYGNPASGITALARVPEPSVAALFQLATILCVTLRRRCQTGQQVSIT